MSYHGDSRTLKTKMEEKKASNIGAGSLPILLCHGKGIIYKFIIVLQKMVIFLTDPLFYGWAESYYTNFSLLCVYMAYTSTLIMVI